MLIVADRSPLIVLINIGHIEILPQLFGTVVIPPAVRAELGSPSRPQLVRDFISNPPQWLLARTPLTVEPIPSLHGILEQAAESNLLDLADAFDRIKRTDFWVSPTLLDARLKLYQDRTGQRP